MENVFIPFPVAVVKYHDERNSLGENVLPAHSSGFSPTLREALAHPSHHWKVARNERLCSASFLVLCSPDSNLRDCAAHILCDFSYFNQLY